MVIHDGLGQEITVLHGLLQSLEQGSVLGQQQVLAQRTDATGQLLGLGFDVCLQLAFGQQNLIPRDACIGDGAELTGFDQRPDRQALPAVFDCLNLGFELLALGSVIASRHELDPQIHQLHIGLHVAVHLNGLVAQTLGND